MRVVGIDVGARRLHAVALDGGAAVVGVDVFAAGSLDDLVGWAGGAEEVAIDSPDLWSTAPHGTDETLAPKFRTARCAEIALGSDYGIWVPWTTPVEPAPGWIQVGIDVFAALRGNGYEPIEVFPYAVFRVLAGRRLPPKQTPAGARGRVELLGQAGVAEPSMEMWSHDTLDAAAAALVALQRARGTAVAVTCGHDHSAIWLPAGAGPAAR